MEGVSIEGISLNFSSRIFYIIKHWTDDKEGKKIKEKTSGKVGKI